MTIRVYTDGGARGNPGPAAIGVVIEKENGKVESFGKQIGVATNNVAEYTAVVEAYKKLIEIVAERERGEVVFFLDSLLVKSQITGSYKVKDKNLLFLFEKVKQLEKEWGAPRTYVHIPREQNRKADALVNKALDS